MRYSLTAFFVTLVVLILLPSVTASTVNVHLTPVGGADLKGALLSVQYKEIDNNGKGTIERMMLSSNNVIISVPNNKESALFIVDFLDTPAKDYFGESTFLSAELDESNTDVLVFPIGYVQGQVVDSNNNLIGNSDLSFECSHGFDVMYPTKSDAIGSFKVPNMPIGSCRVSASLGNKAGNSDIVIVQGTVVDVKVVLSQPVHHIPWAWIVGVVIISVIVFGGWFWFRSLAVKKSKFKEKEDKSTGDVSHLKDIVIDSSDKLNERVLIKSPNVQSSHAKIILETLSEKERIIAEFLQSANGESTAAAIRHACNIPRTSLLRTIQGLEKKKVVSTEKVGKMVKIKFTLFFLGK